MGFLGSRRSCGTDPAGLTVIRIRVMSMWMLVVMIMAVIMRVIVIMTVVTRAVMIVTVAPPGSCR